ncbi:hypothetical protein D3C80_1641020 [compost metagenome]
MHQCKLAPHAFEIGRQPIAWAALKVAKWLEQCNRQPKLLRQTADIRRFAGIIQQVVFKNLHAVKTGGGNGFQLFRQGSCDGYGGN